MTDPRPERLAIVSASVVIDCVDPVRLVDWWHELTGWPIGERGAPWSDLARPDGSYLGFQQVPEPRAGKNRVHLDLQVADEEAAVAWAQERLGAALLWRSQNPHDRFVVLADPEGNEFCFVVVAEAEAELTAAYEAGTSPRSRSTPMGTTWQ